MAQLASASGLGPEGPVFESQYPDIMTKQPFVVQAVAFLFILMQIAYLCGKHMRYDQGDRNRKIFRQPEGAEGD